MHRVAVVFNWHFFSNWSPAITRLLRFQLDICKASGALRHPFWGLPTPFWSCIVKDVMVHSDWQTFLDSAPRKRWQASRDTSSPHTAEVYLNPFLKVAGHEADMASPLFLTAVGKTNRLSHNRLTRRSSIKSRSVSAILGIHRKNGKRITQKHRFIRFRYNK